MALMQYRRFTICFDTLSGSLSTTDLDGECLCLLLTVCAHRLSFNFKLKPQEYSLSELEAYLASLPQLAPLDKSAISAEFGPENRLSGHLFPAIPSFYDFNARIGGTHLRFSPNQWIDMLHQYIMAMATKNNN